MDWFLDFGKWCFDQWVLKLLFLLVIWISYLQVKILLCERLLLFLWFLLCLCLWYHWKRFCALYAFEYFRRFALLCRMLSLLMILLFLLTDFQMWLCWYVYLGLVHTGFDCLANRLWWYDTSFELWFKLGIVRSRTYLLLKMWIFPPLCFINKCHCIECYK
jgi:hypothetical protein